MRVPPTCELKLGESWLSMTRPAGVVFHLSDPDPDFLFKLAPCGRGADPTRYTLAPRRQDTSPGVLVRTRSSGVTKRQISFARNPYFHEWSHAAQPDGNPDRILWRIGRSPEAEVRAIEHGRADWMLDFVPVELRSEVQTQHAAQLHSDPVPETDFFILNTRRSPFNDVRVRRALNYALDRR